MNIRSKEDREKIQRGYGWTNIAIVPIEALDYIDELETNAEAWRHCPCGVCAGVRYEAGLTDGEHDTFIDLKARNEKLEKVVEAARDFVDRREVRLLAIPDLEQALNELDGDTQ